MLRSFDAEELRRREEEIKRRDEDVELRRRLDAIDLESKQKREAIELESKRKREAMELEIMKVRHRREEEDAEEEDERRSSLSSGTEKVNEWLDSNASQNDASPPLSPRYVRSPTNSYQSSLSLSVRSETSVTAVEAKTKPTPKPRKSLSGTQRERNGNDQAAPNVSEADFVPVSSKKKTSSTKLKTVQKAASKSKVATPGAKRTPEPIPRSKVAAPKATPHPKTMPPSISKKPSGKTTQVEVSPNPSYTLLFNESSPVVVEPEVTLAADQRTLGQEAASNLVNIQAHQFEYQYMVSQRPKKPFSGKGNDIDFEQYLRKFEAAIQMPGLTAALKLSEAKFWFINTAGIKVSRFLLRENKEEALEELIAMLKMDYGKRRTTPDEMLEDLMGGDKIPQKDLDAVEEFVAKLESVYYLALDTGRSDQFDKKTLFEGILANKLPQFKHKWIVRWSRKEQANGPLIFFIDFIDYLKTAVRIARNLDRCDAATKEVKRDVSTKDPGFPKTAFRRADGASYKGDAASKGDAVYRGDAYLRGDATLRRDAAYWGDAYVSNPPIL